MVDDLQQGFDQRAATGGTAEAVRWYRRQVLGSLPPLARRRLERVWRSGSHRGHGLMIAEHLGGVLKRVSRRPLIPAVVIGTLTLGIGAVTAVFSVADAVLLRPLPLPDAGRIVRLYSVLPDAGAVPAVNLFDLRDVAAAARTMSAVAPYQTGTITWRSAEGPEPLAIVRTGPGFMQVLGLRPAWGRDLIEADFSPGVLSAAIATHRFWRRFAGGKAPVEPAVIDLDGRRVQIVGVLPDTPFLFPEDVDLWVPLAVAPESFLFNRQSVSLGAIARIKTAASLSQARQELDAIVTGLRAEHPATSGRRTIEMRPLAETLSTAVKPTIMLLATGVFVVLLIAAVNVADLLLTDAESRRGEFAVRAALGGDRRDLTMSAVVETSVLAALGLLGALLVSPLLIERLVELYPAPMPRLREIGLGPRAIIAALAAAGLAAALMLWPLLRSTLLAETPDALRHGGRGLAVSGRRLGRMLVVAQVALSVVLLVAGAQLTRTFLSASSVPLGFETDGLLTFHVAPSPARYRDAAAAGAFHADVASAIRQVPGVSAVGSTQFLPFAAANWGDNFRRLGTDDQPPNLPDAAIHVIGPGFRAALGLPLRAGRDFSDADREGAEHVALVNEALSARWLDGAPLGRQVEFNDRIWRVVGVVGDKRQSTLADPPAPELYFPWAQMGRPAGWVAVRVDGPPLSVLAGVKEAVRSVDPTVPLTRIDTMAHRVAQASAPERFRATLSTVLGAVAVLLVVLGLYGVLTHSVAKRTREIGVRMALGAPSSLVAGHVLREALLLAAGGVAGGLVLTIGLGRWLQVFLGAGLEARDPVMMTAVSLGILGVSGLAAWLPARRASSIAPTVALRE